MSSIKSDDEIDRLLNHKNNSLHKTGVKVKIIGKGNHGEGGSKLGITPDRDKDNHASIAVTAELIGQKATSELLGVANATVNKYANGKNSDGKPDKELQKKIEERLDKISNKVVDKVDMLLDLFAVEKMSDLEGKEIPPAVEKLIGTYDKINRRHEKMPDSNRPQVLLWAPKQINVGNYITKEVE